MRVWLSDPTYALSAASVRVMVEKKTDRIVGAHLFNHAGEEPVGIFALPGSNRCCRAVSGQAP
jgi:hypothetical protein